MLANVFIVCRVFFTRVIPLLEGKANFHQEQIPKLLFESGMQV